MTRFLPDRAEQRPAVLLAEGLSHAPLVQNLARILWEKRRIRLDELTSRLWGLHDATTTKATVTLLKLTAAARLR